jgi:D-tyrosyl-tRNA(Tyr) deacylase
MREHVAMRAVVQRVLNASVTVDGEVVGRCEGGLLILLGIARGDTDAGAVRLAERAARLRIFENAEGRFDRSVVDRGGSALVVSQFTLIADTTKGTRPSFTQAAEPAEAVVLIDVFCARLQECGVAVEPPPFAARMPLNLVHDGPVTIVLDG